MRRSLTDCEQRQSHLGHSQAALSCEVALHLFTYGGAAAAAGTGGADMAIGKMIVPRTTFLDVRVVPSLVLINGCITCGVVERPLKLA